MWLKMGTNFFTRDSSNKRVLRMYGKPTKLPQGKGLFGHMGAFFGFGDLIVTDQPVEFPSHAWSISFWMLAPVPYTGKQHTLLQGAAGARYVVIDPTGLRLGTFDTSTKKYRNALKMDMLSPYAFHNIIITYEPSKNEPNKDELPNNKHSENSLPQIR